MGPSWRPASVNRSRTLVLGYGNPGRQDDGLGPAAANAIEELQVPGIRASAGYQLTIEDASDVAEYEMVVFVDAARSGPEPFSVASVEPATDVSCFVSHFIRPELVLAICLQLYGYHPKAACIGIRGYEFSFSEGLTKKARQNLALAVLHITTSLAGRLR